MAMEKRTDMGSIKIRIQEFRRTMADITVITGASLGLGVKFLEAVVNTETEFIFSTRM